MLAKICQAFCTTKVGLTTIFGLTLGTIFGSIPRTDPGPTSGGIPISNQTPKKKARLIMWEDLLDEPDERGQFLIDPYVPRVGKILLWGDTSIGKCLADNTMVLKADGRSIRAGDVLVGMELMGPDGRPRRVLDLHKGTAKLYKVTPKRGGESWECTGNHILSMKRVFTRGNHGGPYIKLDPPKEVEIDVAKYATFGGPNRRAHQIYASSGVPFTKIQQTEDPYIIGVMVGDGHLDRSSFEVTTGNIEIRNLFLGRGCTVHGRFGMRPIGQFKQELVAALTEMGLMGTRSGTKFIPDQIKYSSREDRLRFLAGIIDTDGWVGSNGIEHSTKSERLALDVAFLVRSLGMAASVRPVWQYCQTGGGGLYWKVYLRGEAAKQIPLIVARKAAKLKKMRPSANALRTCIDVQVSRIGAYTGFILDADHKHLLEDFTVVHNSPLSWHIASAVGSGRPFFGLPVNQANVLFIEVDSTKPGTKIRLKKRRELKSPGVGFMFLDSMSIPHNDPEDVDEIQKAIRKLDPGLVIINSLQKIHDLSPKELQTPKIVYGWFNQVCGPDRAYLFIHHERKTPSNPDFYDSDREKFSGSKGWLDSAQVGIQLKLWGDKKEGRKAKDLRLYHHKSQESALLKPLPLILDSDGTSMYSPLANELEMTNEYILNPDNLSKLSIQKDKELSKILKVSEATAKRRRLLVEGHGFPSTIWLEHEGGEEE